MGEPYDLSSMVEQRAASGEYKVYDWKIERAILPDGRPGVVCYFYDLSERQRYEALLQDADRKKDQFLATLAHELRNPLAPIRNGLQLMKLAGDDRELVEDSLLIMEWQKAERESTKLRTSPAGSWE